MHVMSGIGNQSLQEEKEKEGHNSARSLESSSSRTLFDMIQGDECGNAYKDLVSDSSMKKSNKFRFRIGRSASASNRSSPSPIPASDVPLSYSCRRSASNSCSLPGSSGACPYPPSSPGSSCSLPSSPLNQPVNNQQGNDSEDAKEEDEGGDDGNGDQVRNAIDGSGGGDGDGADAAGRGDIEDPSSPPLPAQPVMSLMDLLEETDRQAGVMASPFLGIDEEEEEEEEQVDEEEEEGGGQYVCCVCMVRHKGAAFIPCGHTFCRLCSRELWVGRGNCPLCNAYILEILDIF